MKSCIGLGAHPGVEQPGYGEGHKKPVCPSCASKRRRKGARRTLIPAGSHHWREHVAVGTVEKLELREVDKPRFGIHKSKRTAKTEGGTRQWQSAGVLEALTQSAGVDREICCPGVDTRRADFG